LPLSAESARAACFVLIFRWSGPPGFPPLLARTRREATGVPTAAVDAPHCHSPVLSELAVVALANFLSEFGQLGRGRPTRQPRGRIPASVRWDRSPGPGSRVGRCPSAKRDQIGWDASDGRDRGDGIGSRRRCRKGRVFSCRRLAEARPDGDSTRQGERASRR
jgi:hypothetical protein